MSPTLPSKLPVHRQMAETIAAVYEACFQLDVGYHSPLSESCIHPEIWTLQRAPWIENDDKVKTKTLINDQTKGIHVDM
jgi:hypothetical protein